MVPLRVNEFFVKLKAIKILKCEGGNFVEENIRSGSYLGENC